MTQTPPPAGMTTRKKVLIIALSVLGVVVLGVAGMVVWAFTQLNSNIQTIDTEANNGLGDTRPLKENEAMNILAIGSDSREGDNDFIGGESPGLADTTLVVHLSANNSWATAVSIPRDSMVDMPNCVAPNGKTVYGGFRQFNSAFPIGGPVCVQRTVESLTGLHIDHFVEVDFSGFMKMVDAVGGVAVYIPEPISDPNSKIYFEKGCHNLKGKQALAYVRVRHGVGDGSDISRIERQQAFLSSLIQKVTSTGVLTNPIDLYKFLDAATSSVTTDKGLGGIEKMAPLAVRVREIGLDRIEFTTVPNHPWPTDPNRVIWTEPAAENLWSKLRKDKPINPVKPTPSPSPSGSGTPSKTPKPSPSPSKSFDSTTADQQICPQE